MLIHRRRRRALKSRRHRRGKILCMRGRVESLEPRMMLTTFLVDSLADEALPDDLAAVDKDGVLTLREALAAASYDMEVGDAVAGTAEDEIRFAPDLFGSIKLAGAPLRIIGKDGIQIVGPGAAILTIDGNSIDSNEGNRVITHESGTAHISGLTISGGSDDTGGGIMHLADTLTLERVNFSGNDAYDGQGGGLASLGGNVKIIDCRFESNEAAFGGAIYNAAGGSLDEPSMVVERTIIADNRAVYADSVKGGGIYNVNSFLVVRDTTIERNTADVGSAAGGGIYNETALGGGVSVERSTISANYTSGFGGGIYSTGSASAGQETRLAITNSTISGNSGQEGGGIYNDVHSDLSIVDCTIAYNNGDQGGGVWNQSGLLELSNSIVIGSDAVSDFHNAVPVDPSQPAPIFNIVGGPDGFNDDRLTEANNNTTGVIAGDILRELEYNGGPTRTHALNALMTDNPAIDNGSSRVIIDQRGRPVKKQRDIGAFELQESVAPSRWISEVRAASQWKSGEGSRFGVGFDLPGDQTIQTEPEFLGFEFDTGPLVLGRIYKTWLGRFGGELRIDASGRFGVEYGYYVDSGTVDVNYDGLLAYSITTADDTIRIRTALDIENGSLYTVSPRVGAYADLVLDLDATIGGRAAFFGCWGGSFPFSVHETIPLLSINRQDENDDFDGEIRFVGQGLLEGVLEGDKKKEEDKLIEDWNVKANLMKSEAELNKKNAQDILDSNSSEAEKKIATANKAEADRDLGFANELLEAIEEENKNKSALQQQLIQEVQRQAEIDLAESQRALERAKTDQERDAANERIKRAQGDIGDAKILQDVLDKRSRNKKGSKVGGGEILQLSFGEASGSLLGVEATVSAGLGVDGIANVAKELGTLAVTIPDIQLSSVHPDETGTLSATTDAFPEGSLQDDKRQLAKLSVDVGGLLGPMIGIPAGRYSLDLGPLGLSVQTVSYDIVPRLSVNQAVEVVPFVEYAALGFDKPVDVSVNGELFSTVDTVSFMPGDTIEIKSGGEVKITPRLKIGNRFTNDIGLDVDFKGIFEAFSLGLSLFGESLLNVGPLLTHETTFAEFDLGSVSDQTFDLETDVQTLESFIVGSSQQVAAGMAASPLLVNPQPAAAADATITPNQVVAEDGAGTSENPLLAVDDMTTFTPKQVQDTAYPLVFVAVPLLESDGTLYTEVEVNIENNTLKSIGVIHDNLRYQPLPDGGEVDLERGVLLDADTNAFRLTGFEAADLSESSTALLALTFESPDNETTLTVTRPSWDLSPVLTEDDERVPPDEVRPATINEDDVVSANAFAVTSDDGMDVNGDGEVDALSDGILVLRYLDGFRDAALVADMNLSQGTRTTAAEIVDYLDGLDERGRLDADGNGEADMSTDGILILRQHFGFVGDVLVEDAVGDDATRRTGGDVVSFVIGEHIAVSQKPIPKRDDDGNPVYDDDGEPVLVEGTGFDIPEILDRTGGDPLGLKNVNQPDDDAVLGSTAWVPLPPSGGEAGSTQDSYSYSLTTYNQGVQFTSLMREGKLIGTEADGSPGNGLLDNLGLILIDPDTGELDSEEIEKFKNQITRETENKSLGIQTPLFLDAPDAAAYTFQVDNGFRFESLVIDRLAGDSVLIDPVFDMFLPGSNEWIEVDLSQPFDLPDGTSQFQLHSRALPNPVAHRSTNRVTLPDGSLSDLQPATKDFRVPFGLTFDDGASGQVPQVSLDIIAREAVHEPPAIRAPDDSIPHTFRLKRNGANAVLYLDNQQKQLVQIASATRVEAIKASPTDTFVTDPSGGPLHMLPIVFRDSDDNSSSELDDSQVVESLGVELLTDKTFAAAVPILPAALAEAEATERQIITTSPAVPSAVAGGAFTFDVVYNTDPKSEQLPGIGFRMHYDSDEITLDEAATSDTLIEAFSANMQVQDDEANFDGDTKTDKLLLVGLSSGTLPDFPGEGTLPATLFTAHFTAAADFTGTTINFSESSTPPDYTFVADPVTIPRNDAANVSGFVYADTNRNGRPDEHEGAPGVLITLIGQGVSLETWTDDHGWYEFRELPGGTYEIVERQPECMIDGGGNTLTGVVVASGQNTVGLNFRELGLKPEYVFNRFYATSTMTIGSEPWREVCRTVVEHGEENAGLSPTSPPEATQEILQQGAEVVVLGTNGDDEFVFVAADSNDGQHEVGLNGKTHYFDARIVDSIFFDGGLGIDTATLIGSPASDQFDAADKSASLKSTGYVAEVVRTEKTITNAGTGAAQDMAALADSSADDTLRAEIDFASLGAFHYKHVLREFDEITALSSHGGQDRKAVDEAINYLLTNGPWNPLESLVAGTSEAVR